LLYLFEDCALDTDRRELRRGARLIHVEPQVFDLLEHLIANRERVVSKDDLMASIWGGRIVSESALTTRINAARSAIGDDGEAQRLIKTLPRKGIRFVGVVREQRRSTEGSATASVTKVLVIDDHVLIREALRGVLRELKGEETLIIEASDSRQAMQQIEQNPDVELVLLDLGLPDRDGFEILSELGERYPTTSVVVLSGHHDRDRVMRALDLGALGFIPKSSQREVMLSAFNLIFSGGIYIPPEILDRREQPPVAAQAGAVRSKRQVSAADLGLTERQMEVLALMMQGKSNKAICRALDLSEATVEIHVAAILRALKAGNRTEAVIAAEALGLCPKPDTA
jgi:DNA-binding NarL/FixJ family response regulator